MNKLDNITKKGIFISGLSVFFMALFFELLFLLITSLKGGQFYIPAILFALFQLIPIVFLEGGLYVVHNIKNIQEANIRSSTQLDNIILWISRLFTFSRAIMITFLFSILSLVIVVIGVYLYIEGNLIVSKFTYYYLGFLLAYALIFRWSFIILYSNLKKSGLKFLINPAILFVICTIIIVMYSFVKPSFYSFLIDGAFILASVFVSYLFLADNGMRWEFKDKNFILYIPHINFGSKPAFIPISKIIEARRLKAIEAGALVTSMESQFGIVFGSMTDLAKFAKGKIPYPRYYYLNSGYNDIIYLKGKDFTFIVYLKDSDDFLKSLKKYKLAK